tara:strand:+ start:1233 stop:1937 length:705 start_codon:yes stop_codon:yes gene_type:complete
MAVNINSVYQKVLAISNKEQRGYITPQEFNLLADRAQNEIYENYFHQARNSNAKIKDDDTHTDTLEMLEAKLAPFLKSETTASIASGVLLLPTDLYKLDIVKVGTNLATEVNKKEEHYITSLGETGSVLYPKTTRPIFTRIAPTKIKITPSPVDSTSCTVNYYKEPTTPSFGYVVVNEKALYNSNTSVDFELASSEEEQLVSRILLLSGTIIKQPDIAQTGAAFLQQKNQEQNS